MSLRHWNCLEAVLHCRPALMKWLYIMCPLVSTSYSVAARAFPEAWPCLHLGARQRLKQSTNFKVTKAQTWWDIAPNTIPEVPSKQKRQSVDWTESTSSDWHLHLLCIQGRRVVRPARLPWGRPRGYMCWWQLNKRLSSCHAEWAISEESAGKAYCSFPTQHISDWLPHQLQMHDYVIQIDLVLTNDL